MTSFILLLARVQGAAFTRGTPISGSNEAMQQMNQPEFVPPGGPNLPQLTNQLTLSFAGTRGRFATL
jgi:hypothetical protein